MARLGVKAQTLYAYVSRGRITARPDPVDPRRSLYDAEDVARLQSGQAAEAGPRDPAAAPPARGEADLHSSLSVVHDGRLFYRGLDAAQMAQHASFETVVRRLWDAREINPFAGLKPRVDVVAGGVSVRARVFAVLARRAAEDPPAHPAPGGDPAGARSVEELRIEAASVLNEAIDTLSGAGPRLDFHQRLARAWKVRDGDAHLIRRALALSADHELDGAVVATRAAVDGGATLGGAALAGLVTLAGSATTAELAAASAYVLEARRDAAGAARARLGEGAPAAGFGHGAYPAGDPRGAALIAALEPLSDLAPAVAAGQAATARAPNLALALALTARRLELPRGGAEDLYMLGRLGGLLGHALDQATEGSPLRARLRYVGPRPGAN